MNIIDFFVKTLDGPLYIVSTVICVILIFACIGYLAEKSISEKKEQEKFVTVDEGQNTSNPVEPTPVLPQGAVAFNHAPLNQAPLAPIKNPINNNMGIPTTVLPQTENSLTPNPSTPNINSTIPSIPEIPTIKGIPTAIATPSVVPQTVPTVNMPNVNLGKEVIQPKEEKINSQIKPVTPVAPNVNLIPNANLAKEVTQSKEEKINSQIKPVTPVAPNVNLTPNANLAKEVTQSKEEKPNSQIKPVQPVAPNANLTPNANLAKEVTQSKEEKPNSQIKPVQPVTPNANLTKTQILTPPPVTTVQEATIVAPQKDKNIAIPTANQAPVAPQAPII